MEGVVGPRGRETHGTSGPAAAPVNLPPEPAAGIDRPFPPLYACRPIVIGVMWIDATLACKRIGTFGDGNVHSAILVNPDDPDEVRRADELADRLHKLSIEVGGTVTGEHGTGAVRARYMRAEHGDALDVMKRIKNVMDPKGLLNPGKLYGA